MNFNNYLKIGKFLTNAYLSKSNLPYKLNFAVTYKCNFKCRTCNIWKKYNKNPILVKGELTIDEIKNFFKKSNHFNWISLTGGEPFLRKDLVEIAISAYKNCKDLLILNIPTNGFLTEKIVKNTKKILKETNIPTFIISISLDGTEKIHDFIKNKKFAWENALKTYKKLTVLKKNYKNLKIIVEYTISKFNENCLFESLNKFKEIGVTPKEIYLNLFNVSKVFYNNYNQKNFVSLDSIEKIEEFIKKRKKLDKLTFLSNVYIKLATKYIKTGNYPLKKCFSGISSIFLNPYGNVFPCITYDNNFGSIKNAEYDIKKLLSSNESKKIIRLIEMRKCPCCWTPCEAYQSIIRNLIP